MRINKTKILVFCLLLLSLSILPAQNPVVSYDSFVHRIGMLWNNITNHGEIGDDSYTAPAPSCEWPAGSGNSYLYSGCLWLSAGYKDGEEIKYSVLNERDGEYAPIDSIEVKIPGERSEQDTYTSYWDIAGVQAKDPDPLGLIIKERTYAWSNPLADDFIIVEYTIKNVGLIDTADNYVPDLKRDLYDFTFTIRWDGDVAKRADWPVEDQRVNQDDHALSNANAEFTITNAKDPIYNETYVGWDWVKLVPYMRRQAEREPFMLDSLKSFPLDSMNTFMWDGDNLIVDAEDWGLDTSLLDPRFFDFNYLDDDFGNPDVDGSFNSAGFLGWRFLKATKPMPPKSYVTCTISDDPQTDAARWNDYINVNEFYNVLQATNQDYTQWITKSGVPGYLNPQDYRAITSYGSIDTLKSGDSVVVTIAYGVGGDQVNGGIYSLIEFNKIMLMAQYIVDNDYDVDFDAIMAPPVDFELSEASEEGEYKGVDISWDDLPEAHGKFGGYRVIRSNEKMPNGSFVWETLAEYEVGTDTWPPSADMGGNNIYAYRDTTVKFGFDYYYCVQTISINVPGYGSISTSEALFKAMTPTSAPALTLDNVKVVPNPYIGSAVWNNPIPSLGTSPWEHQLMFLNLTADAIVRIYTLDGDYIAEVKASDDRITGPYETVPEKSGGTAIWNLVTRNNQDAAPGVYIYTVSSATGGKTTGKFVIIR